jgi:short-subunit dehydrogenase involved in D-alanine esterification of teichoic acids
MKRMLILGGTASIACPFLQMALDSGYEITATTRASQNLLSNSKLNWEYLDLDSEESVIKFIHSISTFNFNFIFDFIGKTSELNSQNFELIDLKEYFSSQITNHVFLLLNIQRLLTLDGSLINVSSRSVKHGSFDIPYAAAKAAVHNSVYSIKDKLLGKQKIINVICGLIENSRMFNQMSPENIISHRNRASTGLITVEAFAIELIKLCEDVKDENSTTYSEILIGSDYE